MSRLLAAGLLGLLLTPTAGAAEGIALVGKLAIPGTERDKSGLTDTLPGNVPHDRLGGIGSAIAYTGIGQRYILMPDRGPSATAKYRTRFHTLDIDAKPGAEPAVRATLRSTTFFKSRSGQFLLGAAGAFDIDPAKSLRFDPEGLRLGRTGSLFVADEYGPLVVEFDRQGKWLRSLEVPKKFLVAKPAATADEERKLNRTGRAPNGGFEGLAISPEGGKLYAMLQKPLLQDRAAPKAARGEYLRLLELPIAGGATREFLYALEAPGHSVNEIVAVNDRQFLVAERDSHGGARAKFKRLFLIDLRNATDVSKLDALPEGALDDAVRPVRKELFFDLLDPAFRLAGPDFPAKIEGLAFGPVLDDGRLLLLVTSDNDYRADEPSWIFAFAIDRKRLPDYRPQEFAKPAKD